jgi:hypothetical protein
MTMKEKGFFFPGLPPSPGSARILPGPLLERRVEDKRSLGVFKDEFRSVF